MRRSGVNQPKVKRLVGKYEIGRTIGEGTFAKVKIAKNSENGEHVAIKILDKEKVLKHKMAEQIKREIATMKLIKHPHVVQLFEVMGSKTKIFIVLEFVTGGELFDKIVNHGRMTESEARRYFQQLINAVDYCHSRGVYHRDLKPENLLLDAKGNLKVSDFGLSALSQQVKDDGLLHTTCGTPNYVAPEVLNDRGYDGATADLWSCGVILFVLLAGYLPFDDSNIINLYKKVSIFLPRFFLFLFRHSILLLFAFFSIHFDSLQISAAEFTCPPWLSLDAMKLIARILDPNPMTRITVPEILEDEWFKKDYKPPVFEEPKIANLDDVEAVFKDSEEHHVTEKKEEQPVAMNAFELISMSKGLNLENLFGTEQEFKRETRFTSKCSANEIVNKIEEAAKPLGFDVQKKNYKMRLENVKAGRKGNLNVATEILQVAPSVHVVEMRKAKGDTLEFHKFYKNLSTSLEDVVWKTEEDMPAKK
ncbi:CBL-interacting serine/threonine-protein kinase 3 isoform X1 [Cucurbita pepo subsp. pepo]|uniref:CBL-interacting serine/threonine-protein kinase 3 isoform X1 n=1 Tax=Cucurbita pepo subsp. pepo TaxID=3664 RepID=UPI000C9D4327|nr:CBL-interacting serine/threonine-protein kinase 3 isoform X1 [Cucurbita pepo subsp. pepo]XP_023533188.1 CBL-interacting serine/threonine-protein kinase 3 isoform X1 [Cucurbita pepo subsp. pepo]XP_023533189.1 CBL-interacting serine/threonine-protein kinase 3 isoform X1 [Cucurbita pepo subsp. pepo]XP_023533190.1 CBL-interacting serine/threonine-protein kinase 3 isoform X1 [Cucurbita pepo subsp. pepo]XP_023533191.1 CBL-interacting serine/threonine-protein kinase 3 isoform X1 [Cucurbita pepo sub